MDTLLVRLKRFDVRVPRILWRRVVAGESRRSGNLAAQFTADHRRVREAAVGEIVRTGRKVAPRTIAEGTGLATARVVSLLDDLEAAKLFVLRSDGIAVDWAFPVTSVRTKHRVRLDSGERFFGA